jgi:hypothetical protein
MNSMACAQQAQTQQTQTPNKLRPVALRLL